MLDGRTDPVPVQAQLMECRMSTFAEALAKRAIGWIVTRRARVKQGKMADFCFFFNPLGIDDSCF